MSTDHGQEPIHDPSDLLDELDSIIRAQDMLRHRTIALQARYAALQPHADRYDQPHIDPNLKGFPREYGSINVSHTAIRLGDAAKDMAMTSKYGLHPGRKLAVKVREYPNHAPSAEAPTVDRRRSR
ncbi:hypothetical protein [Nocardia salmonicida]|uniref:hypothetical protein n=1 Tax=Nocardia salmonicida TaxID=53431 RepID=UPI002E2B7998|nr:hypothetical protein [Nocardia salmonicida]